MDTTAAVNKKALSFLENAGEMGKLVKNYNWEGTAMGKIETWPVSLRTILGTILHAKYPMFLYWGKSYTCFYNDAFVPSFGINGAHPAALGQRGEDCWSHTWDTIKPRIDRILNGFESDMHGGMVVPVFKDGKFHDVNWTFSHSPVRNDDGEIEGVLILCNETVNETLTQLTLQESRNELKFAIDAADLATFDYNPKTNRFTGNQRLKEWFGMSGENEIDLSVAVQSMIEPDRERVQAAIAATFVYENGGKYEIQYTIKSLTTGEERVVLARGKTFFDDNKEAYRFNGILLDITKNIVAERKARESEESFKLLTQALPHLIWITDRSGNQIYLSKSWEEYTGFTEIRDEAWEKIVHPEDLDRVNLKWAASLKRGIGYSSEVRLRQKNGLYRWHKVDGVPLIKPDGSIIRWVGAFSDIDEQRLREAQKDEFIAIASHEMKTPLTTAKGYLELLLFTMPAEDLNASLYARKASESLNRLQSFITELLDVSKIQNGKINYNFQRFDFMEMLKDAIYNVQLTTKTHTIELKAVDQIFINGDKLRLMQVIINLLTNAVKYSPEGDKVKVDVTEADGLLDLCVTDYGIGLGQEHLTKVFDKFYRVEEHAVHFQGLGVGLYISFEIIERHAGKMWAESDKGKGSRFCFQLPVNQP